MQSKIRRLKASTFSDTLIMIIICIAIFTIIFVFVQFNMSSRSVDSNNGEQGEIDKLQNMCAGEHEYFLKNGHYLHVSGLDEINTNLKLNIARHDFMSNFYRCFTANNKTRFYCQDIFQNGLYKIILNVYDIDNIVCCSAGNCKIAPICKNDENHNPITDLW